MEEVQKVICAVYGYKCGGNLRGMEWEINEEDMYAGEMLHAVGGISVSA